MSSGIKIEAVYRNKKDYFIAHHIKDNRFIVYQWSKAGSGNEEELPELFSAETREKALELIENHEK